MARADLHTPNTQAPDAKVSGANAPGTQAPGNGLALDEARLLDLENSVRNIFSQNDFHEADMRTIARETGMGFNTIYKYFGDKEGLLFHFVRKWQHDLNQQVIDDLSHPRGAEARMASILATFVSYYDSNPDIGKIFFLTLPMTTWMNNETFSQRALIDTVLTAIKQGQSDQEIRDDIAAVAILDMLLGMIHRAFTMWIYRGSEPALTAQTDSLFDLFWAAVARR